jgi:integrase
LSAPRGAALGGFVTQINSGFFTGRKLDSAAQHWRSANIARLRSAGQIPEHVKGKHQHSTVAELVNDYVRAWEANGRKSLQDIKQRSQWWKDKFGTRAARSIVKDDIETARLELSQGRFPGHRHKARRCPRAVATVNRYLATFKSIFLMALANEKVDKSPFLKVRLQKENNTRIRFLTAEEEARLLAAIPGQWRTTVVFALHTGLRFSEQMLLTWEDIDAKRRILTVRESKAGEARHVPLNQIAVSTLQAIPRRLDCPWVFYTENGTQRSQMARQWVGWLKQAGIENFHWHDLRHTFASRLVMGGVDLYTVMKLMGHHSIEMTQRYAHLAPSHLKQAVEVSVSPTQLTPELALTNVSA